MAGLLTLRRAGAAGGMAGRLALTAGALQSTRGVGQVRTRARPLDQVPLRSSTSFTKPVPRLSLPPVLVLPPDPAAWLLQICLKVMLLLPPDESTSLGRSM